jgi:hypothetical protein
VQFSASDKLHKREAAMMKDTKKMQSKLNPNMGSGSLSPRTRRAAVAALRYP